MNRMKVKDLREIAKSNGLGKSEEKYDFLVEVSEDDCEDLPDCEYLFAKKVKVLEGGIIIEVSEDNCEDLTDYEDKVKVFEGGLTIEISEDDCEDLPDGW